MSRQIQATTRRAGRGGNLLQNVVCPLAPKRFGRMNSIARYSWLGEDAEAKV